MYTDQSMTVRWNGHYSASWYIKWSEARRRVIADFVLYIHGLSYYH